MIRTREDLLREVNDALKGSYEDSEDDHYAVQKNGYAHYEKYISGYDHSFRVIYEPKVLKSGKGTYGEWKIDMWDNDGNGKTFAAALNDLMTNLEVDAENLESRAYRFREMRCEIESMLNS